MLMTFSELREKCKRPSGYIITLFITNEVSLVLTWFLRNTRVTPNQLTIASIIAGLLCALFYAHGYFISGSLLLFVSHVLDCADGNLARITGKFSPIGKWLDKIGDRLCEAMILYGVGIYFINQENSEFWMAVAFTDSILLLLYFYIVDIGLSLQISEPVQKIGTLSINGVHIIWGLIDPFIYGFIVLSSIGLVKIQVFLLFFMVLAGLLYQSLKITSISKSWH